MSITIKSLALLVLSSLVFYSCSSQPSIEEEQEEQIQMIMSEAYEPCCGLDHVSEYDVAGYKVYMPNVFTPNGDGINDKFLPYFNDDSIKVSFMSIFKPELEMGTNIGMYNTTILKFEDGEMQGGWNGINYDSAETIEEREHRGMFKYELRVFREGVTGTLTRIEGFGCVIRCDDEAPIFKDKEGCLYPIQYSYETGEVDPNAPNGEEECFGE